MPTQKQANPIKLTLPPEPKKSTRLPESLNQVAEFQALCGYQCRRPYFLINLTAAQIQEFFIFDEKPTYAKDWRQIYQRILDWARVKKIGKYIQDAILPEAGFYVLPAVTVSVDFSEYEFEEIDGDLGIIRFVDPVFSSCDGQHRKAGFVQASKEAPACMADQTLAVMLIPDPGNVNRWQIFLDINTKAKGVNPSLYTVIDQGSPLAVLTKEVFSAVPIFHDRVSPAASSVAGLKQQELFMPKAMQDANKLLLKDFNVDPDASSEAQEQARQQAAIAWWQAVSENHPDWRWVVENPTVTDYTELRETDISFHSITINALGMVGANIMQEKGWQKRLANLQHIDWRLSNRAWEGMFLINGRIAKDKQTTQKLADYIIQRLNQP